MFWTPATKQYKGLVLNVVFSPIHSKSKSETQPYQLNKIIITSQQERGAQCIKCIKKVIIDQVIQIRTKHYLGGDFGKRWQISMITIREWVEHVTVL